MFALIFALIAVRIVESIPVKSAKIIASVGKHFTLSCDIENKENNVIIWKHGGRVLFAGDIRVRHDDRISVVQEKLLIKNVQSSDKGLYKCEIENNEGVFTKSSKHLIVLEPQLPRLPKVQS